MLNLIPLLKAIHEAENKEEKDLLDFALTRLYGGRVDIKELWEYGEHEGNLSAKSIAALKEVYDFSIKNGESSKVEKDAETLDPSKRVIVCGLAAPKPGEKFQPPRVRVRRQVPRSRVRRGAKIDTPPPSPGKKKKG